MNANVLMVEREVPTEPLARAQDLVTRECGSPPLRIEHIKAKRRACRTDGLHPTVHQGSADDSTHAQKPQHGDDYRQLRMTLKPLLRP